MILMIKVFCIILLLLYPSSKVFAKTLLPTPADITKNAIQLAQNFIHLHPANDLVWDWRGSIFTYGLMEFAQNLTSENKKKEFIQYITDYHQHWEKIGIPPIDHSDHCPSALGLLALKKLKTPKLNYSALEKAATYLRTQKRNDLGALDHLGSLNVYPHSMWVDSLMMYALFAVQYGKEIGDHPLLDFGASQVRIFAKALQDPKDHLFRHARFEHDKSYWKEMKAGERPEVFHEIYENGGSVLPKESAYWLRGNSWVMVSAVEMLDQLPANHPERKIILKLLKSMAEAALKYQHSSGMWSTLMNIPSYEESSGTALVAYAFAHAVHQGYLSQDYYSHAELAYSALLKNLAKTPEGLSLTQNSKGTEPDVPAVYTKLSIISDAAYGVGGFLMLSKELLLPTLQKP